VAVTCCASADSARLSTTDRTLLYSLCAPHLLTRRPIGRRGWGSGQRVPVDPVPLCKARMRGKSAPGSHLLPKLGACRSAAITGAAKGPAVRLPPPSCPMLPDVLAYHRRDNVPGQNPGTNRPPGPSAKITQGARPLRQEPCRTPSCATAPARPPAGTRGGSLMSSRPAAWRSPIWPVSPPPGGRGWPRPHGDGRPAATPDPACAGAFCCVLAGAGCVPRRRPGGVLSRAG
jgi:hypothetical protein